MEDGPGTAEPTEGILQRWNCTMFVCEIDMFGHMPRTGVCPLSHLRGRLYQYRQSVESALAVRCKPRIAREKLTIDNMQLNSRILQRKAKKPGGGPEVQAIDVRIHNQDTNTFDGILCVLARAQSPFIIRYLCSCH